jgi:hypothetical protein
MRRSSPKLPIEDQKTGIEPEVFSSFTINRALSSVKRIHRIFLCFHESETAWLLIGVVKVSNMVAASQTRVSGDSESGCYPEWELSFGVLPHGDLVRE